jgi:hypothetical protein
VEPKAVQTLELQPGWNLVNLEGTPLQPEKFVVLKPMFFDTTRRTYILCTGSSTFLMGHLQTMR